ncbi:MAG TPA: cystathionine gamma-synthase [Vitreimonas sp.]|uniref:cystathionine gamma-synthase n=1 Tax=Vitreimonas sp. TaxID=3069702 RepID=UPI002D3E0A6C|nr:cystathionine gamma-synthase [Vitreimonas sp.]HYD86558.1 cystathionine gamma-synthase [Vitreimonas sp.]
MHHDNKRFGTRCIHAGQQPDPTTGAIMTPVYQTSTYVQKSPGVVIEDYDYARSANPTRKALEANIASLEGGRHGVMFASGLASLAACIHLLQSGDHVVLCDDVYGGTYRSLDKVFKQFGVTYTRVDMLDLDATEAAFTAKTKLVWIETPTNPLLKVIDIEAVARIGKARGAIVCVDNTFATPVLQNPLSLGADIVSHSCTKYIGGHSDVIGGVLITNSDELAERLHYIQNAVGAVSAPWDCFLLLRSTKTLHVRVQRHCENAARIADFLAEQPQIERVIYPGRADHPQHAIAKKQMRGGYGGMITATLRGGLPAARSFLEKVQLFSLAESLGGVESLIEHPAIMTHASIDKPLREALGISDGLVRFSVGIEDVDDLIADIAEALG